MMKCFIEISFDKSVELQLKELAEYNKLNYLRFIGVYSLTMNYIEMKLIHYKI